MTRVKGQYRELMASAPRRACRDERATWIATISRGERKSEECQL